MKNTTHLDVYTEDHHDFYKQSPGHYVIATCATYTEAVQYAQSRIIECLYNLQLNPACYFIIPEPEGEKFDSRAYEAELRAAAEEFVRRIPGTRKGQSAPAYEHSYHVRDILRAHDSTVHSFEDVVCLAGFLHDVVEDGGARLEELQIFGDRVVELVGLCSHDSSVSNSDARWVKMLARLIDANDKDAWAIKVADMIDNLRSSHSMPDDRRCFLRGVKAPLLLNVTRPALGDYPLWRELECLVSSLHKEGAEW